MQTVYIGNSLINDIFLGSQRMEDVLQRKPALNIEYLIVGGGASGALPVSGQCQGGGAGGLLSGSIILSGSQYTVIVGQGGDQNGTQKPSWLYNLSALAGGSPRGSGGSGGGGDATTPTAGGLGTPGQGFAGGSGSALIGGGGGGAGEAGNTDGQGYGGDGKQSAIDGTLKFYAGGGGATNGAIYYPGGDGGGGTNNTGSANTGGGGSAGPNASQWWSGGSGIVVIRYSGEQRAFGGDSVYTDNGYTVHKYTTIGSSSFLIPSD